MIRVYIHAASHTTSTRFTQYGQCNQESLELVHEEKD